jgi:hypothetical protein
MLEHSRAAFDKAGQPTPQKFIHYGAGKLICGKTALNLFIEGVSRDFARGVTEEGFRCVH